ncbi:uncharacterized protein LOC111987699 [Quercus suber]|uniref:uncharacterized protein LOC111987699 n=1 Tax=Quercus suber TaxID=58331 RepID=UPI000CE25655|nr:uncharacterized protein LOC111987699 [Quercus suber]
MQKDATEFVKKCDKCQRFGSIQRLPTEKLTTIASPWPFAQWEIDIIIKTKLDDAKGTWPEELPSVLWAYRTTSRTPTGETPFKLTYGTEAVIPVEVGVTSTRREAFNEGVNDDLLRVNLDCLDEVRDQASNRMTGYRQKMADYYNRRVKLRRLSIGDLVLRKVTTATKDSTQGKLNPTWEGPYRVVHYSRQESYHLETLDGQRLPRPWNIEHLKKYH